VGSHAILVDDHEGAVEDVQVPLLDKNDRDSVLDGYRFKRREDGFGQRLPHIYWSDD
jgi:hypothetical protein